MTDPRLLCEKFQQSPAVIGVIGLGYVGLPLSCAAARAGLRVIGFDTDAAKVEKLKKGQSYIGNIHNDSIRAFVHSGAFTPTSDPAQLKDADAIILCVPTPLNANREPDMSYIIRSAETVAGVLRKGQLVVLESSTYPGTTRDLMTPILEEKSGLKAGQDFFVAFSPEREDPGNKDHTTASIPKLVGGIDLASLRVAQSMYDRFLEKTVAVSSAEVAEAAKLTENIFRAVNIALVNELKVIFDKMDIDVWEVIEAAKTKPFGYMPFYPGPGLGGHCIPIDPFYLTWKAREENMPTRFIELAGEINIAMPAYVVNRLADALNEKAGRALNGAKILLIGMAYKKNVADIRESPAFAIMDLLEQRKAVIDFHDPCVDEIPPTREHARHTGKVSTALTESAVQAADAVVILTAHDGVNYDMIARHARLIVDTRNALSHVADRTHIVKA